MSKMKAKWLILDPQALESTLGGALTAKLVAAGGLEKTADGLQIKDSGIVDSMIADGTISDAKLSSVFIKQDGSVAFEADQSMGDNKLTNLAAPTDNGDAANKEYVDVIAQGYAPVPAVKVATLSDIDLTAGGLLEIDGYQTVAGDLVLVKNQDEKPENGIYVAGTGTWERADFFNGTPEHEVRGGLTTFVEEGDVQRGTGWAVIGEGNKVVGSDDIEFTKVARVNDLTAENGLYINGKLIGILEDGVGSRELDQADNYNFTGDVEVVTQDITDSSNKAASTQFVQDLVDAELEAYTTAVKKQITHVITAGEEAAGYFVLPDEVDDSTKVMIHVAGGPTQVNQETAVGSIVGDFVVLNDNELHFNNNGSASDLTEDIEEADELVVTYYVIPSAGTSSSSSAGL